MERFLERVSISKYHSNIVLKGGVLIASIVGLEKRSTLDIDATVKEYGLDESLVYKLVEDIINIELADNVSFEILNVTTIMPGLEYPGIRVSLVSRIDEMRIPLKLDFSTGDIITPKEIIYEYGLMFEDRKIHLLAYNTETILAEKFETIISRGTANSRMRDFYDVYMLLNIGSTISEVTIENALSNTAENRGSNLLMKEWETIINEIASDSGITSLWKSYQKKYDYAAEISWDEIISAVKILGCIMSDEF